MCEARYRQACAPQEHDPQYEMHMDTWHPTIKMWLFPRGVALADGPLHYVNGSHRATARKLRWLHEMSLPPARSLRACPAPRTHLEARGVEELGFASVRALVLPPKSLVVADTSGLHFRGRAVPGHLRHSMTPAGSQWSSGGLSRDLLMPFRGAETRTSNG